MKVVFVGAGNVATQLALALCKCHFDIIQIYSRTFDSADTLARQVEAQAITDIKKVTTDADIYIFSVKDSILQNLIIDLPSNKGIWLHTAGSIPMSAFKGSNLNYGVLYPFQTFSKSRMADWKNIPLFIEASDTETLSRIKNIANKLSDIVIELSSEKRKYVHLTGVFACNFTNYMYALSADTLKKVGLPFEVVLPLIDETCAKVHTLSPEEAQTGPAIRFDKNVICKHIELIQDEKVKEIYRLISEKIYETHKK